jgi:predicted RNA-binding Zn-ribbon protein involved in translation (DUF1610 family)
LISVSLGTLIFLCLGGMLAGIFGAWLLSESRRQRREHLAFRGVLRCTMCGCEFADGTSEPIAPCPRCGTMNERGRLSRL